MKILLLILRLELATVIDRELSVIAKILPFSIQENMRRYIFIYIYDSISVPNDQLVSHCVHIYKEDDYAF